MVDASMEEFTELIKSVKHPSKSKIDKIVELALRDKKNYKHVTGQICHQLRKAKQSTRFVILCVMDAVCRKSREKYGSKDVYVPRFSIEFDKCIESIVNCGVDKTDKKDKIIKRWQQLNLFPSEKLSLCLAEPKFAGGDFTIRSPASVHSLDSPPPPQPEDLQELMK
eukprot:gene23996-29114_t